MQPSDAIRVVLSILVPFALFAPIVVVSRSLPSADAQSLTQTAGLVVSATIGLGILLQRFRRATVVICLVYLPLMLGLLFYFGLFLVGRIYGDVL